MDMPNSPIGTNMESPKITQSSDHHEPCSERMYDKVTCSAHCHDHHPHEDLQANPSMYSPYQYHSHCCKHISSVQLQASINNKSNTESCATIACHHELNAAEEGLTTTALKPTTFSISRQSQRASITMMLLVILVCGLLWSWLEEEHAVNPLTELVMLYVCTFMVGSVFKICGLPPQLGMLLSGSLLTTTGRLTWASQEPQHGWVSYLSMVGLLLLYITAGLRCSFTQLNTCKLAILRMSTLPYVAEAILLTTVAKLVLGFPTLWAVMFGVLLSATSLTLVAASGYTIQKRLSHINQLTVSFVTSSAAIEEILAITALAFAAALTFMKEDIFQWSGPFLDIGLLMLGGVAGVTYAGCVGAIAADFKTLSLASPLESAGLYVYLLVGGLGLMGVCTITNIPTSAPIGCLAMAAIAAHVWQKSDVGGIMDVIYQSYSYMWDMYEPLFWGLLGSQVNLIDIALSDTDLPMGLLILMLSCSVRVVTSLLVTWGGPLPWTDRVLSAFMILPKLTNQLLFGAIALEMARNRGNVAEIAMGKQIAGYAMLNALGTTVVGLMGPYIYSSMSCMRVTTHPNVEVIDKI